MDWINHPAYTQLRDRLIKRFRSWIAKPHHTPRHLLLLCGKKNSTPRGNLEKYISNNYPQKLAFYAEDVWEYLSKQRDLNSLQMEGKLANISDAVIVIAESPGTYAELGAFTLNDKLRRKLLAIIDMQYEYRPSFINTGPVRWINQDSDFKPVIYTNLNAILKDIQEIEKRLRKIRQSFSESSNDVIENPKYLLLLLLDLLTVIGPASDTHITYYLKEILQDGADLDVQFLLGLSIALQIVDYFENNGVEYYFIPTTNFDRPFLNKDMFSLEEERSIILNAMMSIPEAWNLIKQIPTSHET